MRRGKVNCLRVCVWDEFLRIFESAFVVKIVDKKLSLPDLYGTLDLYKFTCGNTGPIRDDPYWTFRKNSLELIELSSINKVSLV